jgi:hypothetical protein
VSKDKPESEADRLKHDERRGSRYTSSEGVDPVILMPPIRKRGFHRALKAGNMWAVEKVEAAERWRKLLSNIGVDPNISGDTVYLISSEGLE